MPVVLDDPAVDLFARDEFERAWQLDASAPRRAKVIPDTTIVVSRSSPQDFQDRQIYLWIDEEPLGKIRYGQAIRNCVRRRIARELLRRCQRSGETVQTQTGERETSAW